MGLPTPVEEHKAPSMSKKSPPTGTKSVKPQHRAPKRSGSAASVHHHDHVTHNSGMDGRHKRVWKACERCRMKKTKCDGEFPCKRCKDDGLVCTAGIRKKVEFKQLPRGYAEVLENTQFALIATVHKLYSMVRNGEQWTLGEPEMNDRGLPVIHDIAQKLGAIRPNSDIDLPVHSVFPEDEGGMAELARQLEEQQAIVPSNDPNGHIISRKDSDTASSSASPDMDLSEDGELDMNYRKLAFSNHPTNMSSPASLTHSVDLETTPPSDLDFSSFNMFPAAPAAGTFTPPMWADSMMSPVQQSSEMSMPQHPSLQQLPQHQQQLQQHQHDQQRQQKIYQSMMGFNYNTVKPNALSMPNSDPMLSMGNPMIFPGFDTNDQRSYEV